MARILCLWLASMIWAGAQPVAEQAATVNGEPISVKEFVDYSINMNGYGILNKMINDRLVKQEAAKRGIQVSEDEIQRQVFQKRKQFPTDENFAKYLEASHLREADMRYDAEMEVLVRKLLEPSVEVTPEKLLAYYEENKATAFTSKRKFRYKEICVKTEPEAQEIKQSLAGGASFEELARSKSILPSAAQGGEMGWMDEGARGTITERGFRQLQPGQISEPILAPDGIHIVQMEETKEPELKPYESVKSEVEEQYRRQGVREQYKKLLDQLRASAKIQINLWPTQPAPAKP